MLPTLNPKSKNNNKKQDDWVFVNCWSVRSGLLQRGQIVVFISPKDPYDFVIKRLIAVEGDVVENSEYSEDIPVVIDQGHCWVEGDNKNNSVDSSSHYGPISKGDFNQGIFISFF